MALELEVWASTRGLEWNHCISFQKIPFPAFKLHLSKNKIYTLLRGPKIVSYIPQINNKLLVNRWLMPWKITSAMHFFFLLLVLSSWKQITDTLKLEYNVSLVLVWVYNTICICKKPEDSLHQRCLYPKYN